MRMRFYNVHEPRQTKEWEVLEPQGLRDIIAILRHEQNYVDDDRREWLADQLEELLKIAWPDSRKA